MQGRLENEIKIARAIDEMLKPLPKYMSEWYLNLKASRKSITSCQDYIRKARRFLEYIDINANVKPEDISLQACESYMIACQTKTDDNGLIVYTSDSYQQGIWFALHSLLKFMVKCGYIEYNYIDDIERPQNKDLARINSERILLTQKDFNKILKATNDKTGYMNGILDNRNMLILLLFMTTGIRKTALSEINISDIDINRKILIVIDKGNKRHEYVLSDSVIKYLNLWLIDRQKLIKNTLDDALFITRYGERISSHGIADIVGNACKEGIGKRLSPHKLRAGFCSILYSKTKNIEFVRRAVGHSSTSTTQRYITTDNNEREEAVQIIGDILKI